MLEEGDPSCYPDIELIVKEYIQQSGTGVEMIANERIEAITEHDRTVEKDAQFYHSNELVFAALFLLTGEAHYYPRTWDKTYEWHLGRKEGVEALKVAGQFIAAEIDRIKYLSNQKQNKNGNP